MEPNKDNPFKLGQIWQTKDVLQFYSHSTFKIINIDEAYLYYCYVDGAALKMGWEKNAPTFKDLKQAIESYNSDNFILIDKPTASQLGKRKNRFELIRDT